MYSYIGLLEKLTSIILMHHRCGQLQKMWVEKRMLLELILKWMNLNTDTYYTYGRYNNDPSLGRGGNVLILAGAAATDTSPHQLEGKHISVGNSMQVITVFFSTDLGWPPIITRKL
jgi:hypothetical protein